MPATWAHALRTGAHHESSFDPGAANLTAAIDYIRHRYGDPSSTPGMKALARGERYVGY